jgi:uncharacterized protein (DUF2249 family)
LALEIVQTNFSLSFHQPAALRHKINARKKEAFKKKYVDGGVKGRKVP